MLLISVPVENWIASQAEQPPLDAQLLAKEVLDAIRVELLRPHDLVQHPCRDLDS
jgi:hypothetical protein